MIKFCISLERYKEVEKILRQEGIEYWSDFDQGGSRMMDYIINCDSPPEEIRKILSNQVCPHLNADGSCRISGNGFVPTEDIPNWYTKTEIR